MKNTRNVNNELVNSVKNKLLERGYVASSISHYQCCWKRLMGYMETHGIIEYTPQAGLDYLNDVCGITMTDSQNKQQRLNLRAIKLLNDFLETGSIFPKSPKISAVETLKVFGFILSEFKQYQYEKHEISARTFDNYDRYIGRFLMYLENHISQISCLNSVLILDYCKSLVEYKEAMAHNASCSLRVFLRYLKTTGLVNSDYSYKIPSFAYSRKSKLPSVLTDKELKRMLSFINRSSTLGKRDYAIILMASRLGLRSGDIRKLEFGHIHWENNTIEVITEKTGKTIILPLLEDVGLAIIDYIKCARPTTENLIIFQTCNAPVKPISASGMSSIVKRAANTASISTAPTRPVGPHTLRSTLASTMLANDVPLPVISGILGHSNTRTTQEYYLRIDKKQLQKCAIDVPHFSWDPEEEVF